MLCMWATGAKLDEAFDLLYYWGMNYVTVLFIYTKACRNDVNRYPLGFGYYTQNQCEFLLLAKKGTITPFLRKKYTVP